MQTFLPYPSFLESAKVLDDKRLGKQRVEAKQIIEINLKVKERNDNALSYYFNTGEVIKIPWENHPAVRMWRTWEIALCYYGFCMCNEWIKRGFKDTLQSFFEEIAGDLRVAYFKDGFLSQTLYPEWMKNRQVIFDFCYSHRANLMRKDPVFYGKYNWKFFGDYTKEPYKWNKEYWKNV